MLMPGRSYSAGNYRYGFNGKENDNEVKSTGNQQDYGMRVYDPRVGRFLSVDPLTKEYPELTPYQFASNTPIQAIDMDGLEAKAVNPNTGETLSGPLWMPGLKQRGFVDITPPPSLRQISIYPVPLSSEMRQQLDIQNQWILTRDFYGTTLIGKRKDVEIQVEAQRRTYNEALGDAIRNGPGGSIGYIFGGDKGAFIGSAVDQVAFSFAGVPGKSGYLTKPGNARPNIYLPKTEQVLPGYNGNVQTAVRKVGSVLESVEDVMTNPKLLEGKPYAYVRNMLGNTKNWENDIMRKSSRAEGWVLREKNQAGTDYTGRIIQYHPGTPRHFNGAPYWKISSGNGTFRYEVNPKR